MAPEANTTNRRLKIELRAIFVWMFYLAVGLSVGARVAKQQLTVGPVNVNLLFIDWHETLFVVASMAIAVGLIKQVRRITCWAHGVAIEPPQRFAVQLEAGWRAAVAIGLLLEVLLQLSVSRGYFTPPDSQSIYFSTPLTTFVWWMLLFVPLAEAVLRGGTAPRSGAARQLLDVLAWGAMICVPICLTVEKGLIPFLVHVACRGNDATLAHTGNRYMIVTEDLEWRIVAVASGAVIAAFGAGFLFIQVFRRSLKPLVSFALCAIAIGLLTTAGSYCQWYYCETLPRLSPDLSSCVPNTSWYDLLGGAVLALLVATAAAIRLVRRASLQKRERVLSINLEAAPASLPVLLCFAGAGGLMLVLTVIGALTSDYVPPSQLIAFAMFYPDTTFSIAFFLFSTYLLWRRRLHPTPPSLLITRIEPRRFLAAWLAMAATLVVTIPTLAALSISYWLGPWYRW